ncbi:hypothetical protein ACFSUO_01905 [Lentibacillus juripiscarius]|uniref:Uncharacterized protein n=1 Tax=Lentibacillus juripiscarius TaxID=257446 RepID=A0ABW5V516_9BACI
MVKIVQPVTCTVENKKWRLYGDGEWGDNVEQNKQPHKPNISFSIPAARTSNTKRKGEEMEQAVRNKLREKSSPIMITVISKKWIMNHFIIIRLSEFHNSISTFKIRTIRLLRLISTSGGRFPRAADEPPHARRVASVVVDAALLAGRSLLMEALLWANALRGLM